MNFNTFLIFFFIYLTFFFAVAVPMLQLLTFVANLDYFSFKLHFRRVIKSFTLTNSTFR